MIPRALYAYGIGFTISVVIGFVVWSTIKKRLSSVLNYLFPDEEVWRFWEQVIGLSIVLAAVSAGIGFSYAKEAQTDKLVLIWNFMDHLQRPLERILNVFLFAFVPLIFAYVIVVKRK